MLEEAENYVKSLNIKSLTMQELEIYFKILIMIEEHKASIDRQKSIADIMAKVNR